MPDSVPQIFVDAFTPIGLSLRCRVLSGQVQEDEGKEQRWGLDNHQRSKRKVNRRVWLLKLGLRHVGLMLKLRLKQGGWRAEMRVEMDGFGVLKLGSFIYVDGMLCSSMSPIHVEVLAVRYACKLAFRRGWSQAIVESDCQTAITLSSTEKRYHHGTLLLLQVIFVRGRRICNYPSHGLSVTPLALHLRQLYLLDGMFPFL
ncbi:reverse transcriptase [Tanacetum coccineum]